MFLKVCICSEANVLEMCSGGYYGDVPGGVPILGGMRVIMMSLKVFVCSEIINHCSEDVLQGNGYNTTEICLKVNICPEE
jgi:hypothetical protein